MSFFSKENRKQTPDLIPDIQAVHLPVITKDHHIKHYADRQTDHQIDQHIKTQSSTHHLDSKREDALDCHLKLHRLKHSSYNNHNLYKSLFTIHHLILIFYCILVS